MEIAWSLTPAGWVILGVAYTSGVVIMYKLMVRTLRRTRGDVADS